jgi:hypothetical protein
MAHFREDPLDAAAATEVQSQRSKVATKAASPVDETAKFVHSFGKAGDFLGQVTDAISRASRRAHPAGGLLNAIASSVQFAKETAAMKVIAKFRPEFVRQAANCVSLGLDSAEVERLAGGQSACDQRSQQPGSQSNSQGNSSHRGSFSVRAHVLVSSRGRVGSRLHLAKSTNISGRRMRTDASRAPNRAQLAASSKFAQFAIVGRLADFPARRLGNSSPSN